MTVSFLQRWKQNADVNHYHSCHSFSGCVTLWLMTCLFFFFSYSIWVYNVYPPPVSAVPSFEVYCILYLAWRHNHDQAYITNHTPFQKKVRKVMEGDVSMSLKTVQNWKITVIQAFSSTSNKFTEDHFPNWLARGVTSLPPTGGDPAGPRHSCHPAMHETFTAQLQKQCKGRENGNQKPKNKKDTGKNYLY
jgi:hypothetical protein